MASPAIQVGPFQGAKGEIILPGVLFVYPPQTYNSKQDAQIWPQNSASIWTIITATGLFTDDRKLSIFCLLSMM
jgi:hypothetical protein